MAGTLRNRARCQIPKIVASQHGEQRIWDLVGLLLDFLLRGRNCLGTAVKDATLSLRRSTSLSEALQISIVDVAGFVANEALAGKNTRQWETCSERATMSFSGLFVSTFRAGRNDNRHECGTS